MKRLVLLFTALAVISCTELPLNTNDSGPDPSDIGTTPSDGDSDASEDGLISAEKNPWIHMERSSSGDKAFAKDLPWQEGEKVLLIRMDSEKQYDQWGNVKMDDLKYTCTVAKASGLKCKLVPDVPLETGVYHAVYPVYRYVNYNKKHSSLSIHLSFVYEEGLGLDYKHQDIVVSEPVSYKEGHKLSIVMKHVCALVDIDIYPPKTGNFSLLKVVASDLVFAGKANYVISKEYDVDDIADVWFNFTTLRGDGTHMKEGELYQTSTGLLPVQYDGMPMSIYIVYEDGTYYLSEPFPMPSLNFGVQNTVIVDKFNEIDKPVQGYAGDNYMDDESWLYSIWH